MTVFTSTLPSVPPFKEGIVQTLFRQRDANDDLNRPCYIDALTNKTLTFAQVRDMSLRFGASLQDVVGFQQGDVLAVIAPNVIDYAVVLFGTLVAGGVVSPANPNYTSGEIAHQLRETQAKVMVIHPSALKSAVAAAKEVGTVKHIFVFGDHAVGDIQPYTQALLGNRLAEPVSRKADDLAYLCFSSGTTGKSKGVMTSHDNIITNVHQFLSIERTYFTPEHRQIAILPFFHIYALTVILHAPFYTRTPMHVLPRFDLTNFLNTIQKYKITFGCVVPPVLVLLAKNPDVQKYDLGSLRAVMSGAAPLSVELMNAVLQRFPKLYIKQGYGLTETSPVICMQPDYQIVPGSSGILVPDSYNKVVDEDGKELGVGERGELWSKGRNVMKGYLNRPEETAKCIDSEGYFHTGDVAIIDKDGNVFIVDRLKELIKYKGFQVAPAELEGLLLKHPQVADCAVIGVYNEEEVTEIPRAYIVLKPGVERSKETAESLQAFIAKQVAHFKQIKSVIFRDEIPKSATGKILRKILKEEVKQELAAKATRARL
ncbi:acetyl-CoA synthetase-like protein [Lichtheimia hyalospora FSU 10163]|nr:acetyl-CoA synthetase-like protein [Lichtheimia hyalospora FSU 10163]